MEHFEKLGAFYLGRQDDGDLVLYDAKDLTTHALCVGMTGSGKTGLCISLLEEAAIDGIPAIIVDPKGDMGNLLLRFPDLDAKSFRPWIDPAEAARKGSDPDEHAQKVAERWASGIAEWGQDADRIRRLMAAAEVRIYTPGSDAGLPVTVLRSFAAPPRAIRDQREAFADRIESAASGLLALLGIEADPIQSRETILLSNLLQHAWKEGRDLDLPTLIREVLDPPFTRLGVFDLDSFYPTKERSAFAMTLNGLIASPSFATWLEGEPLEVQNLLYSADGRPRHSVFSIAHLSDRERMFFVTTLLNEVVSWMRTQSGTSSLRAIFYMDEIFGYFPPTREPPSKKPMLTLLKQARAFGLGCVLATQNPVDLDYKGLSNCGTWFLGRLQTERDKMRVLDGLEGAMSDSGAKGFDRARLDATLSSLGPRRFLLNNVHQDGPVVFQTRFALSYLAGPLTRSQIQTLTAPLKTPKPTVPAAPSSPTSSTPSSQLPSSAPRSSPAEPPPLSPPPAPAPAPVPPTTRPVLTDPIPESFLPLHATTDPRQPLLYRPTVLATGRLHFVQARDQLDEWRSFVFHAPLSAGADPIEVEQSLVLQNPTHLPRSDRPQANANFAELPPAAAKAATYRTIQKRIKSHVYSTQTLTLYRCARPKLLSEANESEADFRGRVGQIAREERDLAVEKLRKQYTPKMNQVKDAIQRAREKVGKEEEQYQDSKESAWVRLGQSVLGALFGRKLATSGNVSRAGTAIRSASKTRKEKADVERAKREIEKLYQKMQDLEKELRSEVETLERELSPSSLEIEAVEVKARKGDIEVDEPSLVWTPWRARSDGVLEPAHAPLTRAR